MKGQAFLEDIAGEASSSDGLSASYLTHELRAPVTAIRLGLEILREQIDSQLSPEEKQTLSMAVKNTTRLEGLINDIMDYAKINSGKLAVRKEPSRPRDMMTEAVDSLRSTALSKGVRLTRDEGEPLPRIACEPRRIVQILTNLISNSIKHTPQRGVIRVSAALGQGAHEGTVVFKVKDTGCGIPAADLEKIFDLFAQSENSPALTGGTGLGLTLARRMVELHGGRIWAESWRQLGATFFFTIPIASSDMARPVQIYPKEIEVSGLLATLARRLNTWLALFV
jgi:signal transduction histidine kinase